METVRETKNNHRISSNDIKRKTIKQTYSIVLHFKNGSTRCQTKLSLIPTSVRMPRMDCLKDWKEIIN